MYRAELDIAVALFFFIRPDTLEKVFLKVKRARPAQLFLIQDGAREGNETDMENITKCREIVEDIDWECKVYKNYSTVNMGCGIRPYTGISWVFEHVERAIFLEDDCVASESFFAYCREMLYRYEKDMRIGIISGLNYFKEFDFGGYSYGFVKTGAIWGWATWKDRWQKYDYRLSMIEDPYIKKCLILDITPKPAARNRISTWEKSRIDIDKNGKVPFWDYQWGFIRHINSWLSIVPMTNLISNIGVGLGATHSGSSIRNLNKRTAGFFFMETKDLRLPLRHPDFIMPNREYDQRYYRLIYPSLLARILKRIRIV